MLDIKKVLIASAVVLTSYFTPAMAEAKSQPKAPSSHDTLNSIWQDFHSVVGKCTLKFPVAPEHIAEKMTMPKEGYDLQYDAYISTKDKKSVYMLLIAQYPEFVDQSFAQVSLEGFLNGILSNNPGNQLLYADLILFNGYEALDFFIRTGAVYFKGRAIMVKNNLYLMAMECEVQNYDEGGYNFFINSFKLNK